MSDTFKISLASARVNAQMTQQQAAEAMKVSKSTIVAWEKGKAEPRASQIEMLCNLYRVPIQCIFLN